MLRKFLGPFRRLLSKRDVEISLDLVEAADELEGVKISASLKSNRAQLEEIYYRCDDIVMREFEIGTQRLPALLIYLEGFIDKSQTAGIMDALMLQSRLAQAGRKITPEEAFNLVVEQCLVSGEISPADNLQQVTAGIFNGKVALFIDGADRAVIVDIKAYEHRDVAMPETEVVIRGPREGFIEELVTNLVLVRRRIKGPQLKMENMVIGEQSATSVVLAYVKGIVDEKVVEELRRRLQRIEIDAVLDSGYLESYIEEDPYSLFPTVGITEKPDVAAAKLLEGRAVILSDGSPFALTMPHLLVETFQVAEDYYGRAFYASLTRLLRIWAYFITLYLPAIYVAAQAYHPEMIPTILMVRIAGAREGIPFPAWMEAFLMLAIFELIKEAGLRMPRAVGQAVAIVGTLVLGDAAIRSGIVTPAMVIIVALSGIAGFIIPPASESIVLFRYPLLFAGSLLGLLGVALLNFVIFAHAVSLRSCGVPYTSPLAPSLYSEWKDVFIRTPLPLLQRRPRATVPQNLYRQPPGQTPHPPEQDQGEQPDEY
ncbi:MAG: spore germination protein [Firmicutes bacterium]|nr:spore germination protein [Bacillota bacterium]